MGGSACVGSDPWWARQGKGGACQRQGLRAASAQGAPAWGMQLACCGCRAQAVRGCTLCLPPQDCCVYGVCITTGLVGLCAVAVCVLLRWYCCLLLMPAAGACWPLSLVCARVVHRVQGAVQTAVLLSAQILLCCFRRRPGGSPLVHMEGATCALQVAVLLPLRAVGQARVEGDPPPMTPRDVLLPGFIRGCSC